MRYMALSFSAILAAGLVSACGNSTTSNAPDTANPQVVGGWRVEKTDADVVTFKSTVALTTEKLVERELIYCSGTLVSPRVIVTAAHCLVDEKLKPRMPDSDIRVAFDLDVKRASPRQEIERILVHPEYNPEAAVSPFSTERPNDIGIVVLKDEMPDGYESVPLNTDSLQAGTKLLIAGFGAPFSGVFSGAGRLRAAWLNMSKEDTGKLRIETTNFFQSACSGDSGGPLYAKKPDGSYALAGVVSAGTQFLTICTGLNLFTDASKYADWIQGVVDSE